MSISEYLQKQDPPKTAFEGLSGAGLGMSSAKRIHCECKDELLCMLRPYSSRLGLRTLSECGFDTDKSARIADLLIGLNIDDSMGANVMLIEICDNNTYSEAKKRIRDSYEHYADTMREAFIYRFDNDTWEKQDALGTRIISSQSSVFKMDLAPIIATSDFYHHIVNKTYK